MRGFVIARCLDGRAIMEGTNACAVRWGFDPARVRVYQTTADASHSLRLLCDEGDRAFICEANWWTRDVDVSVR